MKSGVISILNNNVYLGGPQTHSPWDSSIWLYTQLSKGNPYGVVVNVLDCNNILSELEF